MDIRTAQNHNVATDATWTKATQSAVTVESGATLVIAGSHEGPVTIESLGTVLVSGDVVGSVTVRVAGTLVIEADGCVTGSITNFGSVTNFGLRAGRVEGREPDDKPGSRALPVSNSRDSAARRLPPR